MSRLHCSPQRTLQVERRSNMSTCLTMTELKMIAEDYNKSVTDPTKRIKTAGKTKAQLHEAIRESLKTYCDEEHCWIEQNFLSGSKRNVLDKSYRPKTPKSWYKNRRTWLNTYDILNVMRQYEQLYKNFEFLGVFPIDFTSYYSSGSCIGESACTLEISNLLQRKKSRFGLVLNLDDHTQSGSHWVAVYCNIDPKQQNFGIYYYDSVAQSPPKEVRAFFSKIKEQIETHYASDIAKHFEVEQNRVQKQFKNTECGMFSIVFLTQMLKNISFEKICKHMRKDDGINEIRDIVYRP